MARPMNKLHQEDVRKKIQASQLVNVLQKHALTGEGELSPTRMKAIEILLRKSMPDLSAVQMDANVVTRTLDQELADLNEAHPDAAGGSEVA
jgi:hypothetical protein